MRGWLVLAIAAAAAACTFQPNMPSNGSGDGGTDGVHRDTGPDTPSVTPPMIRDHAEGSGTKATLGATLAGSASDGDAIVAMVRWSGSASLMSVTDADGETLAPLVSFSNCAVYFVLATTAARPDKVTATFSQSSDAALLVADYTGVSTTPIDGLTTVFAGTGDNVTSEPVTTTLGDDRLVAEVISGAMPSAGSGFTTEGGNAFSLFEDRVAVAPMTYNATATFATSTSYCLGFLALAGR
jgi:hypothetical protein